MKYKINDNVHIADRYGCIYVGQVVEIDETSKTYTIALGANAAGEFSEDEIIGALNEV